MFLVAIASARVALADAFFTRHAPLNIVPNCAPGSHAQNYPVTGPTRAKRLRQGCAAIIGDGSASADIRFLEGWNGFGKGTAAKKLKY